jgi:aminoglycoside 6'-N-acetyltransferase I
MGKNEDVRIHIREVRREDAARWERLRCELWPDGAAEHAAEIESFFAGTLGEPAAGLVAEDSTGEVVGFAELSIRTELKGLESKRVGYVEGLYVRPEIRGQGVARKLMRASRNWAREQGCTAFASDRAGRIVVDRTFERK